MQTFLAYPDFAASAKVLDVKRLGKQRVEAWQLIRAINGETKGWANHPAAVMWRGHLPALHMYGRAVCSEWIGRGYNDTMLDRFEWNDTFTLPRWFGDEAFHAAHRSNLLRKDPVWYGQFNWFEPDDLDYIWPAPIDFSELLV